MKDYLFLTMILYILSYLFYINISHGLGRKAEYLQFRRFLPCAILAVLPCYLAQIPLISSQFLISFIIGIMWIITFPILYYATYHKNSFDFGFHLDIVFGLYIISWLTSLKILVQYFNILPNIFMLLISILEFTIALIPILQWIYFYIFKTCINENALSALLQTDYNESIEFYKSLPKLIKYFLPALLLTFIYSIIKLNLPFRVQFSNNYYIFLIIVITGFLTIYLWKPNSRSVFSRTGVISLLMDIKYYLVETLTYNKNLQQRLKDLQVSPSHPNYNNPSTIIMVIGESESRDYMSSFSNYDKNTTPWLKGQKENKNFLLFPNAYSCHHQTVPTLERALTEANQYNDKKFYKSCSVIDIARKAGYITYWYSNQGNLGGTSTAVTLIAETADTAKWTKQNLNKVQYDEALIDYLKEVDQTKNNFIVLHLMGNHFNFLTLYPKILTKWEPLVNMI